MCNTAVGVVERIQVRFPEHDLEQIRAEVENGRYPNTSEAVRDKVRKSYLLEAMLHMRTATEDLDQEEALQQLEQTRRELHAETNDSP